MLSPSCRLETVFVHQNSPHWQAGKGWRELERGLVRSTLQFSSSANPHTEETIPGRWDALFLASCKFLGSEQSSPEAVRGEKDEEGTKREVVEDI